MIVLFALRVLLSHADAPSFNIGVVITDVTDSNLLPDTQRAPLIIQEALNHAAQRNAVWVPELHCIHNNFTLVPRVAQIKSLHVTTLCIAALEEVQKKHDPIAWILPSGTSIAECTAPFFNRNHIPVRGPPATPFPSFPPLLLLGEHPFQEAAS